jgi:hypothetical protein
MKEKMVEVATRKEKDHIKSGLRILAKIIARDIYGKWIGSIDNGKAGKINKLKEKAKS